MRARPCGEILEPLFSLRMTWVLMVGCSVSSHLLFSIGFDALWMPFWKRRNPPLFQYCVVPSRRVGTVLDTVDVLPEVVQTLPAQPSGTTRVVFMSDTHSKHELVGKHCNRGTLQLV